MTFTKKSIFFLAVLFCSVNLSAQTINPVVHLKESVKQISENEFQVILNVEIDKGWKLYVAPGNDEGPIIFTSEIKKNKNVELVKPFSTLEKPTTSFDDMFQMNVTYLKDKATFVQTVKLKNPKKSGKLDIKFGYMTCDGTRCLPPTYKVISYDVETGKSSMGSSRVEMRSEELFDSEF